MREDEQFSRVVKRDAPSKKHDGAKRKIAKRRKDFKSISWYSTAELSVAIPYDRRDQR